MAEPFSDRKLQRNGTNSSLLGGIGQRFNNLSLQRRATHDTSDDTRGPLGLSPLTDPKDPLVELIFVHGLRGDSVKTWTFGDDPATFWPRWLEDDSHARFSHVRIHTYGYSADWTERRVNASNVNDFGASLLHWIVNNACFIQDAQNPIVFIAHSLGGLVVKKAFILAKQNPEYVHLSRRFHTILFLATPHRGAASATLLNNILRASSANFARAYVSDLEPNSSGVEAINESFRHLYHGLRLVSFYELRAPPTLKDLVVDKQSATLGFSEERQVPLNTDHFGICRFATASDPVYIQISEVLGNTVSDIIHTLLDPEQITEDMRILGRYLGLSEAEEDELSNIQEGETPGSCQWLLKKPSFIDWRDAQSHGSLTEIELPARTSSRPTSSSAVSSGRNSPRFFWLTGPPGTGKSVLAAHVVRHLHSQDRQCSFFFLRHSDKSRQNLSSLLKSLAHQMARRNLSLRQSLLSMRRDNGFTAETNDIVAIWKQLFTQKVFRTEFSQRQYWVIDALDECHGGHDLIPLLARIAANFPLSIFLTSRGDTQLEKSLHRLPTVIQHIDTNETLKDIRLFLEANKDFLPLDDPVAIEELINKLLHKSRGSFLWIRLVLELLETSWSDIAIDKVLEDVPPGMYELYSHVLEDMAKGPNQKLAQAILRWVVCGARLLTTFELQEAIRLDINQKVFKLEKMIEDVCGQLVTVDKRDRVQLVHDTARDFLLDKNLVSSFAIDKAETHAHLADICLRYLMSEDIKGPLTRRPTHTHSLSDSTVSPFKEYAALHWSEHVVKSFAAASRTTMGRLENFLETSVLSWIEYVARKDDLSCLTQTAKNLKSYVDHRVDFQSPLDPEMKTLQDWAVDLIRIVTVFGRSLLRDPSIIHGVIPALCPPNTMLFRKFGNPNLGLEVVGLSPRGWADRIHSTTFAPDHATAIACSEKRYAVGLRSGTVVLYYASTCQEASRLPHGEIVKQLAFAHGRDWLVVSGKARMSMWNFKTSANIWTTEISSEPMALTLGEDDSVVIAATKSCHMVSWATADGLLLDQHSWHGEEASNTRPRPPRQVYISSELNLLALVYRNQQIRLFGLDLGDLTRPRLLGGQSDVSAMAFNPVENMLAMVFFDGELCTVGLWNLQKVSSAEADASHLAASTDGKTLLVGTNSGSIQIRDFETLNVMQTIRFNDEEIMAMLFTGNGLRVLDIRRQEFNLWEPSTLVRRKENSQSTSESETFSTAPSQLVQAYTAGRENFITTMVSHHSGEIIFCGKDNGAVSIYEQINRGRFVKDLFGHGTPVMFVDWNAAKEVLVTSDSSSRILIHRVKEIKTRSSAGTRSTWQAQKLLDKRLQDAVRQVLLSLDGEYLLVSTLESDRLWTVNGESVLTHECRHPYDTRTPSQKWTTHPRHKRKIFEVGETGVHVIEWGTPQSAEPTVRTIVVDAEERIDRKSGDFGLHFVHFPEDTWAAYDDNPFTSPLIWPAPHSSFNSSQAIATALAHFAAVAPSMKKVLGMASSRLVFLDREGWICTLRLDEAGQDKSYKWHFPLPHCWQITSRQLLTMVTAKGDVVVAKGDELAIVKRWQ